MRLTKSELIIVESARLDVIRQTNGWQPPDATVIEYMGAEVRLPPMVSREEFDEMQRTELKLLRTMSPEALACHSPHVAAWLQNWRRGRGVRRRESHYD